MISHKFRFIFIHIPKTSGSSLSVFLKNFIDNTILKTSNTIQQINNLQVICERTGMDIKHKDIKYYENLYGNKINDYFKFTIVRNPYDRILSFYFFFKGNKNKVFNKNEFIDFLKKNDFSQYKYINDSIYVIHYENLINELKNIKIFKNIVNFNNYPKLNVSYNSKISYTDIFDEELKNLIFNKYMYDFKTFGYKY
jgi:hypothetical protein